MKFQTRVDQGKSNIFWEQGNAKKQHKKFGYKKKEQKFLLRGQYQTEELVPPIKPMKTKQTMDFIKKNQDKFSRISSKPHANTGTLTQEQLDAILASVGKLPSGKGTGLRISIDAETNELTIKPTNELPPDVVKDQGDVDPGDEAGTEALKPSHEKSNILPTKSLVRGKPEAVSSRPGNHGDDPAISPVKHEDHSITLRASPPVVGAHLTVAEKKRLQWAREKAELPKFYDPWGRPGAGAPMKPEVEVYQAPSPVTKPATQEFVSHKPTPAEMLKADNPPGHSTYGTLVSPDENKYRNKKEEDRKQWLEDLEKQKEERLLQILKEKALNSMASGDTWFDKMSSSKPVVPSLFQRPAVAFVESKVSSDKSTPQAAPVIDQRNEPSAIRSSFTIGHLAPDENKYKDTKEEQRRLWLEDLEKQKEEKRLQNLKEKALNSMASGDTWFDKMSSSKPVVPSLFQRPAVAFVESKVSSDKSAPQAPPVIDQRNEPSAIRSSFTIGHLAPDENKYNDTKEEQRRLWLEDLEKQKEERRLQKVREKELNNQPYVETWAEKRSPRVAAASTSIVVQPEYDSISPRIMSAPNNLQLPESSDRNYIRGQNVPLDPASKAELEEKRKTHMELQNAIKAQIAEKERLKRIERENKIREEMEEEGKLKAERDRIQSQFNQEQQKVQQKEESRQQKHQDMKAALDEAQEKALTDKHIRRMQHLQQGGHDIHNLRVSLEAKLTPRGAASHREPAPGLASNSSAQISDGAPHPVASHSTTHVQDGYTQNRVLTPTKHREDRYTASGWDPLSPCREFGTQTVVNNDLISRENSEAEIEYKGRIYKVAPNSKKTRVQSAQNINDKTSYHKNQTKPKWGYQNKEQKQASKQSERDPFYERKKKHAEQRKFEREQRLLGLVAANKNVIPSEKPLAHRSHNASPEHFHKGSKSPMQSKRTVSPVHGRNKQHVPPLKLNQPTPRMEIFPEFRSNSPPVPTVRHKMDSHRDIQAKDTDLRNNYNLDLYNYNNYQRQKPGKYTDTEPFAAPVFNGEFVPFMRTTEILDPADAASPMPLSREVTKVEKARRAYIGGQQPGNYGEKLKNYQDKQYDEIMPAKLRQDPLYNPAMLTDQPTQRQDRILQQLSSLKQTLLQRQREIETCMSPSDLNLEAGT